MTRTPTWPTGSAKLGVANRVQLAILVHDADLLEECNCRRAPP
ncbi:hypothetical protein ABZV78_00290 [Micromonospora sp. NPDC004540]